MVPQDRTCQKHYTPPQFEAEYACSGLQFGEYMHDSPRWNMPKTPYAQPDIQAEYACSGLQFGRYMHGFFRIKHAKNTIYTARF